MDREEQRVALVSGLDDPVRRRLYDYVSASGEAVGREEAAAATGIGRPLAAYHLDRLVSLGLLAADGSTNSPRDCWPRRWSQSRAARH